ncbi:D-amino acid dehydrogenase small subunit [Burkholderia sp. SG-MS1]|uniref:D-amino acid dehydrogenase n=1 Tax=Paraburkholderia sp. SG-MS1 TaxID=2023741 RepID=UPI001444FE54|nr:D-amino acid dehydrogenase [Paraburkholderia sp. SG-MS1]NKJ49325.1 D-amino acid dehydrogenase small subunit [Paraburkholderia sp. SG-MS1]
MQIMVLGAGVIGLTSAYYLNRAGHQVVIVDRHGDVAAETSFGNAGQLSYSYVAPLAGPGVLSKLPLWLTRKDSPVRLRPSMSPAQWRWCLQFALACSRKRSEITTRQLLSLSFASRTLIHQMLRDEPQLDFDFQQSGKLVLHRDAHAMQSAVDLLEFQRSLGCEQSALSADECVALEPALADMHKELAGGIYTSSEDTADCHRFCQGLAEILRARGVEFALHTPIDALRRSPRGHIEVRSNGTTLQAQNIVVAMGTGAARLLKPLGIDVPVYPLKGYSLTYHLDEPSAAPRVSVTDFARKVVYARLGNRLRVAGMADIEGYSRRPDPARLAALRAETAAFLPKVVADRGEVSEWTGLRPATPRGTPIIGATPYRNLWLNVGHGALGFTLAAGSAVLLTSCLENRADPVPSNAFALQ